MRYKFWLGRDFPKDQILSLLLKDKLSMNRYNYPFVHLDILLLPVFTVLLENWPTTGWKLMKI